MNPKWIYDTDPNNKSRFTLGIPGERMLFVLGLNPSKAHPGQLDMTITKVKGFAERNAFDGWLMLNLYPQRATLPENLHKRKQTKLLKDNFEYIKAHFQNYPSATILACWGNLLTSRGYLSESLIAILQLSKRLGLKWVRLGELTKAGHPRHPSRVSYSLPLVPFDVESYIKTKNH